MEEKVPNLKLRNARRRNNWKQQDVADRIGTTPLSVGRWERGEAFPSAYYRKQLCDLFRMSPEELGFTEEELLSSLLTRQTQRHMRRTRRRINVFLMIRLFLCSENRREAGCSFSLA